MLLLLVAMVGATPKLASAHGNGGHCDFDADGYDDLAVGSPYEDVGEITNAGSVNVIYGSAAKLTSSGNQLWTQETAGITDTAEFGDWFGASVECGDFDDDGYDDLAIGVPLENDRSGAVQILFGSDSGLMTSDSVLLHRGSPGVKGKAKAGDRFGWSLASGDLNGDGYDDLAVGAYLDGVAGMSDAGSVQVFYGSAAGLSTATDEIWHRATPGIKGAAEKDGWFGYSLSTGDFNGDSRDDLAIGSPGDNVGGMSNAGSVSVILGSDDGLTKVGDTILHRNRPGIAGTADSLDWFGAAVAAADFDGDGFDDLAVGVPLDDVKEVVNAGSVHTLRGGPDGLRAAGDAIWHRGKPGVNGNLGFDDQFGHSIATADFNADSRDDLAVSVYQDDYDGADNAGSTHVIYGSGSGLIAAGDQTWHENRPGINGKSEENDLYGYSVSAGDFDGNGYDDLVSGVPLEAGGGVRAGKVSVVYAALGGLSSAGDQVWTQDSPGVGGVREEGDSFGLTLNGTSGAF